MPMSGITYILAIAVENYHETNSFQKVSFAEKDATEFVNACISIGYHQDDTILLLNEKATKSTITTSLHKLKAKLLENDRVFFYFAGHGFCINGNHFLAPVDANIESLADTCISIDFVLGVLKKSASKRNILFLDCCHSGFELGEFIRDNTTEFNGDDLKYIFKDIEYCVGFASCQSKQKSHSHNLISNGVWSHFLIKALRAEGPDELYETNCLMSDKLQTYLREKTSQFVKKNINKKDQIPIQFGNAMDRFIVSDLSTLFESIAAIKSANSINLTSISIYRIEDEAKIKNLPGFTKGYHSTPTKYGQYEDSFIKSLSQDFIKTETDILSNRIQKGLGYKRKEVKVAFENGIGMINTPDFSYSIEVLQSEKGADKYDVRRSLDYIINSEIIDNVEFNEIFYNYFTSLSFSLPKKINVAEWIDKFEDKGIKVDYDVANLNKCAISLNDLDTDIILRESSFDIFFTYPAPPKKLIEAYKNTTFQLAFHKINLLE
jgi:Caspase domain